MPAPLPWTAIPRGVSSLDTGSDAASSHALASFFSDSLLYGDRWGRKTLGSTASVTPHDAPRPSMRHSEHPCSSPLYMLKGHRFLGLYPSPRNHQQCLLYRTPKFSYNNVVIVSDEQLRDSSMHIHVYPFSPKAPSHPGCHITLSRISSAMRYILFGYPF